MSLTLGARLGAYEIISLLGIGGMGEVYRARDTKLKRDVAIKVLPETFAHDADRLARFRREAELLAALNHPNIAAIYGLEESGGIHAIVMELVDGPTLADHVLTGPISIGEALAIARQIAEALEAAHENGITHRDLKPANIKMRSDGMVKVLDFGLAKAFAPGSGPSTQATDSPTLSIQATRAGVILGTAAYMSPEQARGRPVDKRTDIWALGAVLYELLTGVRTFEGDNVADILSAVVSTEPKWHRLPPETPPNVVVLLKRCLNKDKALRLRDAGDARIELQEALTIPAAGLAALPRVGAGWRRTVVMGLAGLAIAAFASVVAWSIRPAGSESSQLVARLTVVVPPQDRLAGFDYSAMAFSPDGKQLAYVARRDGVQSIFLRSLDSRDTTPVRGTEDATGIFFSPDGKWLGFFTEDGLKRVSTSGGNAEVLASVGDFGRGGSWGSDGSIIFAPDSSSGLVKVSALGGVPEMLTTLSGEKGEASHRFPHHLPDGKAVLLTVGTGGSWDEARIEVLRLDTGERRTLMKGGSDARYVSTGHLVYVRAGSVMAVRFDLGRLEITGVPVTVVDGVMQSTDSTGAAHIAVSALGWFAYVPGSGSTAGRTLAWVDREGNEQVLVPTPRPYRHPRLSPDGQRVTLDIDEGNKADVWTYDVSRGALSRITSEGNNQYPVWTSDGSKLTFRNDGTGPAGLFWKSADGNGTPERLTGGPDNPATWSTDGLTLAFTRGRDIWTLSVKDGRTQRPFLQTRFNEIAPAFSPDGRSLAYVSNETGRYEVYVQPFPGPGEKWQVSTEGGTEPVWSRDGREILYRHDDRMMAAGVEPQLPIRTGKPQMLFMKHYWAKFQRRHYDVTSDGKRFVMIKENDQVTNATEISIVLNWFDELNRLAPRQ